MRTNILHQQMPILARMLGIILLFVLTSCPIKASIKQNLNQDFKTETKSNKAIRSDSTVGYPTEDCSVAQETMKTSFDVHTNDFQPLPAIQLYALALILLVFLPREERVLVHWNVPEQASNDLLLQTSRLNL
ncbi:hypothetical protein [Sphingobacterium lactis]|uniref:Lipoprotein n=1 Tax=Sphingobacterium lactis TaxID=797291 RepID=A0A1H5Y7C3_9SPHI|nr:hypothetical protein [Sphingobacterium lactis]SEG19675.1 hypothetical protein SAMN05421877_105262 [Sphingobacterium lactis]